MARKNRPRAQTTPPSPDSRREMTSSSALPQCVDWSAFRVPLCCPAVLFDQTPAGLCSSVTLQNRLLPVGGKDLGGLVVIRQTPALWHSSVKSEFCGTFKSDIGGKLDRRRQHISIPPTLEMTHDCALYFIASCPIAFIIIHNK